MESHWGLGDRWLSLLGAVGFCSLTGALIVAHSNPATGYELSIYAATPIGFWVGSAVSFLSALLVAFSATEKGNQLVGTVLGGMTSFAVVSLPMIRGYYFHGIHDSVTHVAIMKGLRSGAITPLDTIYPGIHVVAAFLKPLTGFGSWRSVLFVPLVVVVVYFVFTPLIVREVIGGDAALTVGAFSAFLLVPLHQLASTLHPHPSSQAILFSPVVLFFLIWYLRSSDSVAGFEYSRDAHTVLTPVGISLLVATFASILYHPQQAQNLIILFVMIGLIQYVVSKRSDLLPWTRHHPMGSVIGISVIAYFWWVTSSPGFFSVVDGAWVSLMEYFGDSSSVAGEGIGTQSSALRAIGSSLPVMFLKMFSVSTIYIVFAGTVLLTVLGRRFERRGVFLDTTRFVWYFVAGLVGMFSIFVIYYVGNVGQYYFRQASFMMMVVTILGAIGIVYSVKMSSKRLSRGTVRSVLTIGFAVLFVLSVPIMFNSPYIHRANQHVTEAKVDGYEATFGLTNQSAYLVGVRQEPQRLYGAIVDRTNNGRRDGTVNSSSIHYLRERRSGPYYLIISRNTYEREIEAYQEYRYTRSDLESVRRQIGVSFVYANGDTELYYVSS
jgi:hypothetical protein